MAQRQKKRRASITLDALARKIDALGNTTAQQIDRLAQGSQREFEAIRSEMATKGDLKEVLRAIESIDVHLSATAGRWSDDFDGLRRTTKDHEERLRLLEKRHRLAS